MIKGSAARRGGGRCWAGWLLGCLLGLAGAAASAQDPAQSVVQESGVAFQTRIKLAGQDLRLNGTGVRAVAWFKGYAAGLYLAQPTRDAAEAMASAGAKRLRMHMLVDVSTHEFIKAFRKGVDRNTAPALKPALSERMGLFERTLAEAGEVHNGDVIDLDFVPGRGLLIVLNGAPRGSAIPGADLYTALLGIFLGERPVDKRLKAGLLGGSPG